MVNPAIEKCSRVPRMKTEGSPRKTAGLDASGTTSQVEGEWGSKGRKFLPKKE